MNDLIVYFDVPGAPMGKQRPRHNRYTNATYTPEKTRIREEEIAIYYRKKYGGSKFPNESYLSLSVMAYMPIPKSASKAVKAKMRSYAIMPTVKPDCDNILKLVADALNGIAYDDDKQIVKMTVTKAYSETPRTEIHIAKEIVNELQGKAVKP